MDFIRHMRRSAFFLGRPGGLIREITWKVGKSEVICLHGGFRLCRLTGHPPLFEGIVRIKNVNPVTLSNRLFTLSELKIFLFFRYTK